MDMISVQFDGEADISSVSEVTKNFENDQLYIQVSGNTYNLI